MESLRDNSQVYGAGLAILSFPVALYFLTPKPFGLWFGAFCATLGAFGMFGAGLMAYETTTSIRSRWARIILLTALVFGPAFLIATWIFLGHPFGWMMVWLSVMILWLPCLGVSFAWSVLYVVKLGPLHSSLERLHWGKAFWMVAGSTLSAVIVFFAIKQSFFKN